MAIFKCKICGGALEIDSAQSVATCEYCGTKQTLPRLDDERRANLYDRANHFRRNNDFDKAMGIFEQILNEEPTDAEAYWSIVLCRYGIEYVEDPATRRRVPTVNRAQFTSIFDDEDYKSAIANADGYQRELYEAEATAINELQKGILAISQKEEPFDVFICYKETDDNGRRTQDSVLATELYHELTEEGFKVFFSRITLEDKLGIAYEPYIFAALHSAKVMVVLGTRPEHFNAVWVKNEWSRYLALIKNGAKKILIPAYRDMDPYDLPDEFSHLQAQDMSKLGFMQDLVHGIKKIANSNIPQAIAAPTLTEVPQELSQNIDALLKRAFFLLEDGEFDHADELCEQILNKDPENPFAYLGKLLAELKITQKEQLSNSSIKFADNKNYKRCMIYAPVSLKKEMDSYLVLANKRIQKQKEEIKKTIVSITKKAILLLIISSILISTLIFVVIPTAKYNEAQELYESGNLEKAFEKFSELGGFKDSLKKKWEIEKLIEERFWVELEGIVVQIPNDYGCSAEVDGNRIVFSGRSPQSINVFLDWLNAPAGKKFCEADKGGYFRIENVMRGKTSEFSSVQDFDLIFYYGYSSKFSSIFVSKSGQTPSRIMGEGGNGQLTGTFYNSLSDSNIFFSGYGLSSEEEITIIGQYCDIETEENVETFEIVIVNPEWSEDH